MGPFKGFAGLRFEGLDVGRDWYERHVVVYGLHKGVTGLGGFMFILHFSIGFCVCKGTEEFQNLKGLWGFTGVLCGFEGSGLTTPCLQRRLKPEYGHNLPAAALRLGRFRV